MQGSRKTALASRSVIAFAALGATKGQRSGPQVSNSGITSAAPQWHGAKAWATIPQGRA